jgi:hypothetical protein
VPSARLAAVGGVALLVVFGSAVRVHGAWSDPRFDAARPERLLKSDPALLHYMLERVIDAGGGVPADFRADPRVEHPERVDLAVLDSVGMEFPLAWIHRATGGGVSLVALSTIVMAVVASLAVVGVYLLARELSGRVSGGLFAALLFALSPASYRTIGFVLMREDASLPLFALHLGLLARAARVRTPAAFAAAGLAALAAAATWHAMGFVLALEAAALFAWFTRTGRSPLAVRHAWIVPVLVALGSFAIPLLRARWFVWSVPMQLAAALGAGAVVERYTASRGRAVAAGLATLAVLQLAGAALGVGTSDYAHVTSLLWAKLVHLGAPPEDPRLLPFDVRLMWQGPFETAALRELFAGFTVGAVLLPVALLRAAPSWLRGRGDGAYAALAVFALLACAAGLAIRRVLALPALLLPAVCAPLLPDAGGERRRWLAGLSVAQALAFAAILPHRDVAWYFPLQQEEIAAVVDFIRRELPPDGAIAADNVTSPAVLALTGHPIVVQPKYETASSRRRNERLLRTLYEGSTGDLRALLREWDVRWLLVDRQTLWLFRWVAGLPLALHEPPPGTAAWRFLSQDPARFDGVAGFRLVYRSALPQDMMRLYEVQ